MATELERLVVRIEADAGQLKRGLRDAERSVQRTGDRAARNFRRFDDAVRRTNRSVLGLKSALAGLGFAALARTAFTAGTSMQRIENALLAATGDANLAGDALQFVREESERLGLDLETAATGFSGLAAAAQGTALEGQLVRDVFSAVSEAATTLTLSAEQTGGTFVALQQIIGKGVVSMEELRQQLGDRIPGATQIAARAMGVTVQQLFKMIEAGDVLAENFLPRFASELRKTFGAGLPQAINGAQQSLNRFNNAVLELRIEFARSGFLDAITDSMNELRDTFKDPAFKEGLRSFGEILGKGLKSAVENAETLLRAFAALQLAGLGARLGPAGAIGGGILGALTPEILKLLTSDAKTLELTIAQLDAEIAVLEEQVRGSTNALEAMEQRLAKGGLVDKTIRQRLQELREVRRQLAAVQDEAGTDGAAARPVTTTRTGVAETTEQATDKIEEFINSLAREVTQVGLSDVALEQLAARERILAIAKKEGRQATEDQIERAQTLIAVRAADEARLARQTQEEEKHKEAIEDASQAILDARSGMEEFADETVRLIALVPILTDELGLSLADALEVVRKNMDETARTLGLLEDEEKKLSDTQQRVVDGARDLGLTFQSAFEDAIVEGESLREVLDGIEKDIIRILVRKTITEPVVDKLVGFIEQQFGGGAAAGATAQAASTTQLTVATTAATSSMGIMASEALIASASLTALAAASAAAAGSKGAGILTDAAGRILGGIKHGGLIKGRGTGTSDSILATVSDGEFVVNAEQTRKHFDALQAINENRIPRFQGGGMVPRLVSPTSTVTSSMDRSVTINSLNIVARDADDVRRQLSRRQIARILSNQAQAGAS